MNVINMKAELELCLIKIALTKAYVEVSIEQLKANSQVDDAFYEGCKFTCKEILSNIEEMERKNEKPGKSSLIVCL